MEIIKTLGEFIIDQQTEYPDASGELTSLFSSIRLAAKILHREINKAGLADIMGSAGEDNVQGEQQQKLDVKAMQRDYARDQYDKGNIDNRDMVEAEDDYVRAQNALNRAKASRWSSLLEFRLATETLRIDQDGVQQPD